MILEYEKETQEKARTETQFNYIEQRDKYYCQYLEEWAATTLWSKEEEETIQLLDYARKFINLSKAHVEKA